LSISAGTLDPPFSSDTYAYLVGPQEMFVHGSVTLTPLAAHAGATITVDGLVVASGTPSSVIDVPVSVTPVLVRVTAEDGESVREYNVIITRQGISLQTDYIKASNTEEGDRFGHSVALDGDTLVVGARHEDSENGPDVEDDNLAPNSGAVYVFVRHLNGTWSKEAYLKASNTDVGDEFGWSVALDGDTLVVGAIAEASNATGVDGNDSNNSALESGAAYVFVRSSGYWSQQAYLKASNTGTDDLFGQSVALDGDTLVVGASGESSNAMGVDGNELDDSTQYSGAAYVFVRSDGIWAQEAYLKASNTDEGDRFGTSVALDGGTLVVSARGEDSNAMGVGGDDSDNTASNSGAAYVFVRSAGIWSQEAYLKASNTDANDYFGWSVALDGDTLVVGADERSNAMGVDGNELDNSADNSGAAYVFVRSDGTWSQEAYLKASNTDSLDYFGRSVALEGDTLVVGAHREDSNATGVDGDDSDDSASSSGAVYVFVRSAGTWSQEDYLKAFTTDISDRFGNSVALAGDTLVVGASTEDSSATGVGGDDSDDSAEASGAVYIFK
ncbi:MAG: cadherin-like beta sandwich domain-containing protein, partial [bacterium]